MFSNQKNTNVANGGETVIAYGVKIEGDFVSGGDILIEGEIAGSVKTSSSLTVGENAVIHANVNAQNATIAGRVDGNLKVSGRVDFLQTSQINGDIDAEEISVVVGARINGRVIMSGGKNADVDESESLDSELSRASRKPENKSKKKTPVEIEPEL